MKLITIALIVMLTGCSGRFYAGIGMGKNGLQTSNEWIGENSLACTAEAGYLWRQKSYDIDMGWSHYSQCSKSNKWNSKKDEWDRRDESTLDSFTLRGRYYF